MTSRDPKGHKPTRDRNTLRAQCLEKQLERCYIATIANLIRLKADTHYPFERAV